MGARRGIWADAHGCYKSTDGVHFFRVEYVGMCMHVHLVEIFKYFHMLNPFPTPYPFLPPI